MAIMIRAGTRSSRKHSVGAINDTGLYTKTASSVKGTSAYWSDVVDRIERAPVEVVIHPSFYRTENVEEDARPIAIVAFMEAPPDDTDW